MSRKERENRSAPHSPLTWVTKTLCLNFHYYAPTKQELNSWTNQRQQTELSPAPTEETSVTINVSSPVFKESAILLLINMWTRPWCKVYLRWYFAGLFLTNPKRFGIGLVWSISHRCRQTLENPLKYPENIQCENTYECENHWPPVQPLPVILLYEIW